MTITMRRTIAGFFRDGKQAVQLASQLARLLACFQACRLCSKQYGKTACLIASLPASRLDGQLASLLSCQHPSDGISKSCRRFCGLYRKESAGRGAMFMSKTEGEGGKVSYGESRSCRHVAAVCCVFALVPS
jgi:hypothetical protein